jgi:hypothetical protein
VTLHLTEGELANFLSGSSDADDRTRIQSHINSCEYCGDRFVKLSELQFNSKAKPKPELMDRLLGAVAARNTRIVARRDEAGKVLLLHEDGTVLSDSDLSRDVSIADHPFAVAEIAGFAIIVRWDDEFFRLGVSHKEEKIAVVVTEGEFDIVLIPDELWFSTAFDEGEAEIELSDIANEVQHRLFVKFEP